MALNLVFINPGKAHKALVSNTAVRNPWKVPSKTKTRRLAGPAVEVDVAEGPSKLRAEGQGTARFNGRRIWG